MLRSNINDNLILLLTAIVGLFWGAFLDLQWTEIVESGLVHSGLIQNYVPWYVSNFSSQITIPAILFKLGLNVETIAVLSSAICVSIAFTAVASVALIFSPIKGVALLVPILLCKYPFYNFHYYPIKYPIYNYIFGQVGLFLATLTIALMVLDKKRAAFLFAGILVSVHLVWGAAVFLFFLIYLIINRIHITKNKLIPFLTLGLVISFSLMYYHMNVLEPKLEFNQKKYSYKVNQVNGINTNIEDKLNSDDLHSVSHKGIPKIEDIFLSRNNRFSKGSGSHNLLFKDHKYPAFEAIKFFLPDIALFIIIILLLKSSILGNRKSKIKKLAISLFIFQMFVIIYKVLDEIDPTWRLVNFFDERLVAYIIRATPNRLLNLDSLILPVILITVTLFLAIEKKNIIAIAATLLLIFTPWMAETGGGNYPFNYLINLLAPNIILINLSFLLIFILLLIPNLQKYCFTNKTLGSYIFHYSIPIMLLGSLIHSSVEALSTTTFPYGKNQNIILKAREGNGLIITTLGVQGYENFNILSQTLKPYYIETGTILIPIPNNKESKIELYCNSSSENDYSSSFKKQVECFKNRKPEVWRYLGDYLGASQILANKEFKLNLPLVAQSENFKLYAIQ
jgi:hypothetical protein